MKSLGGLHILGTERHEARRIDNQLRGRSGRQGDPGSGRFYLSLEDDLMRIFAGEWVKSVLTRLGMKEGEAIESRMVCRRIEGAQKKVEERNFDIRKNLLEYDEVMDEQRKRVYSYRQRILDGGSCKELILDMIDSQIEQNLRCVSRQRLRRRNVRQMGRQFAFGRTRSARISRPRFRNRPSARPDEAADAWPNRKFSKRSKKTCPKTKKTIGIGRRWRNLPMRAGKPTCAIAI